MGREIVRTQPCELFPFAFGRQRRDANTEDWSCLTKHRHSSRRYRLLYLSIAASVAVTLLVLLGLLRPGRVLQAAYVLKRQQDASGESSTDGGSDTGEGE
jgi:hypothetical protein